MCDNNMHLVQKVCADVCAEFRDKVFDSSPYGQLPGLFRVRYLKNQQICAFRVQVHLHVLPKPVSGVITSIDDNGQRQGKSSDLATEEQ